MFGINGELKGLGSVSKEWVCPPLLLLVFVVVVCVFVVCVWAEARLFLRMCVIVRKDLLSFVFLAVQKTIWFWIFIRML